MFQNVGAYESGVQQHWGRLVRDNLKNLSNGYSKEEVSRYLQEIQPAPLKFNIALSYWEPATIQGRAVKFRGGGGNRATVDGRNLAPVDR